MKNECKWVRPMTTTIDTRSDLFTGYMTRFARVEMSDDDCEKYYVDMHIPGTDLKHHFCMLFTGDMDEAERNATQLIREQLEEWYEICGEYLRALPQYEEVT